MKKWFWFKVGSLILAAAVLLTASVMLVAAMEGGTEAYDASSLVPDVDVAGETTPASQSSLAEKFSSYTVITEEDGKTVASIYSEQQIRQLTSQKEEAWVCLTSEELLYLLNDTRALFETCEEIRLTCEDGTVKTYVGLPYYLSDDYQASYGGFGLGTVTRNPSDVQKALVELTVERIRPLHSAVYDAPRFGSSGSTVFFTGIDSELSNWKAESLLEYTYLAWYEPEPRDEWASFVAGYPYGAFWCSEGRIDYIRDVSDVDRSAKCVISHTNMLPTEYLVPRCCPTGKNVMLEVWDEQEKCLVSSLCLTDAEQLAKIEQLWSQAKKGICVYYGQSGTTALEECPVEYTPSRYRVCVYLNGIRGFDGIDGLNAYYFVPEGNFDLFAFVSSEDAFAKQCIVGMRELNTYLAQILADRLG